MVKQVGGVNIQPNHRATCHCGMVELELDLPEGLVDPKGVTALFAGAKALLWPMYHWTVFAFSVELSI